MGLGTSMGWSLGFGRIDEIRVHEGWEVMREVYLSSSLVCVEVGRG